MTIEKIIKVLSFVGNMEQPLNYHARRVYFDSARYQYDIIIPDDNKCTFTRTNDYHNTGENEVTIIMVKRQRTIFKRFKESKEYEL